MSSLTHEEAISIAKGLAPSIKARQNITEELRSQPQETIRDMVDSGLIRLMQPKRWEGHALHYGTLVETTAEIAKADPSAGWCYSLFVTHAWMVGCFSEQAQADVWKDNPNALISSSFHPSPSTQIIQREDGLEVSGEWGFSSGINHCDWTLVSIHAFPKQEGEKLNALMALVPKKDYEVVENWITVAQKGSGSNQVKMKNVFIPKHRIVDLAGWCQTGVAMVGGSGKTEPLYHIPLFTALPAGLCSALFGASKGAYEMWRNTMRTKISALQEKVADMTHQQIRVAEVSGLLEAAEALLLATAKSLQAGGPIELHDRMRIRRNFATVAKLCNQAVRTIIDHCGAAAIYESNPLQRFWRDIQASSMHITLNMDWIGEMFGKLELGLPLSPKDSLLA